VDSCALYKKPKKPIALRIGLLTASPLAAESGFVPRDLKPPFGPHFRFSGGKVSRSATFFPDLPGLR
jgi:hypothetical protein